MKLKRTFFEYHARRKIVKISKLTASLLTSTAVFAGVLVAQQGQSHTVSADSKLRVDYSSNLRQQAGTDANIIGGLKVGETYSYDKTATANGYTWYEIGNNKWVASAGAKVTGGQVVVTDASNKRVGPSTSHKIVGGYYPGQKLTFTETAQAGGYTWYKVGKNAWVASAGVTETGVTRVATQTTTTAQPASTTTTTNTTSAQTTTPAASTTTTTTPAASTTNTTTAAAKTTTPAANTTTTATTTPTVTAASGKVQTTVASNVRSSADTSASITGSLPAGTIRNYTATSVADGYTWYQVGTNQWVAGAKPYYGTASATTSTQSATTASNTTTQSQRTTASSTTTQSSNTTSSYTSTTTSGTQTAKNSAGNTYAWGQCTWYVKSVAPWAGNYWGNGAQWGASAAAEGFTVNHTPSVGSIVVVAGGQNFGGWTAAAGYGHVAYVVAVNGNTITVQQGGMGFSNPAGPNTQTVSGASNFTYIHR
jgi:surface antigen/uncharacterized protein YgiM (DUF1202 family)